MSSKKRKKVKKKKISVRGSGKCSSVMHPDLTLRFPAVYFTVSVEHFNDLTAFYMENVKFYDWKLDRKRPLSWLVSVQKAGYHRSPPDVHSALHLIIVQEGASSAQYNQSVLTFSVGEVFVTAPWEVHSSAASCARILYVLNIDPVSLQEFFFHGYDDLERLFLLSPEERKRCLNSMPDLARYRENIASLFALPDSEEKALRLWYAVLGFFMQVKVPNHHGVKEMNTFRRLRPALLKLSGNVLTANEAAKACHLSVSYFSALFKQTFGLSFARYERIYRLNGAAGDIRRGVSLKEAADSWGFCDKSHLARLLKDRRTRSH